MPVTTFSFIELPVTVGGIEWHLTGEDIQVFYEVEPADPEVGIMEGGTGGVCIEDNEITLTGFYKEHLGGWTDDIELKLSRGMFAFTKVEEAAQSQMEDAANADAEEDGYDPDQARDSYNDRYLNED